MTLNLYFWCNEPLSHFCILQNRLRIHKAKIKLIFFLSYHYDKLHLHGECQISQTCSMGAMSPKHPIFDNSCIKVNLTIEWKVPCLLFLPHIISLVRAYYDATFEWPWTYTFGAIAHFAFLYFAKWVDYSSRENIVDILSLSYHLSWQTASSWRVSNFRYQYGCNEP